MSMTGESFEIYPSQRLNLTQSRATFKNPNFENLCELGKIGSRAQDRHSKILILNRWMNCEKFCPKSYVSLLKKRYVIYTK